MNDDPPAPSGPLPARLDAYARFRADHPDRFVTPPGGVEIVTDPTAMARIEHEMGARYAARGLPPTWAEVGLLYEDPYLLLLRDAVLFPDGSPGVHHRVLRRSPDPSGVAVLPLLGAQIVLVRHFRHPTRSWQWEVPRGAIDPGDTPEGGVRRELMEEISGEMLDVVPLGRMHGSTGLMGMTVALFLARLSRIGEVAQSEGIAEVRLVTVPELEAMVRTCDITDSFTLGCILHARLKGLI